MTDPVLPRFKQGDKATLPGVGVVTIMSWPATNEGYVVSETYHDNGDVAQRRTDFYGEDRDGEPVDAAAKFVAYDGPEKAAVYSVDNDLTGLVEETPIGDAAEAAVDAVEEPVEK